MALSLQDRGGAPRSAGIAGRGDIQDKEQRDDSTPISMGCLLAGRYPRAQCERLYCR